MPAVYLCGSITPDPACLTWREHARVAMPEIEILDPCRGKEPHQWTKGGMDAAGCVYADGAFVPRDLRDIRRADALLLHWWGEPGRQSIGTWFETGFAHALGRPVVVSDPDGRISAHPFVSRHAATMRTGPRALEEACAYLRWLLA